MNIEEYNERLTELIGLVSGNIALDTIYVAGNDMLRRIKTRIAEEGRNSENASIGSYSTKPIYVPKQLFTSTGSFVLRGKGFNKLNNITPGDRIIPGQRLRTDHLRREPIKYKRYALVKSDLKPRKTMYMPEGYKELRDTQGLRTDIMNFKYRGDLLNSYVSELDDNVVLQGLNNEFQSKKRKGLEEKFGRTFYPTEEEKENYKALTSFLIRRIIRGQLIEGNVITANIE